MPAVEIEGPRARRWPVRRGAPPPHVWVSWRDGAPVVTGEEACALGHRHEGRDGRPRGVFASWSWDGETLTAEVDPLGYFNLFVFAKGAEVALSPSLLQLVAAGADTTLDHRALAVFFRLGMFIHDDTPLRYVRALPPGGKLHWRRGELTIEGAPFVPKVRAISRSEAVDGFLELVREAIDCSLRSWNGEVILPLSGGRDSRHILLEMDRLGRPPSACVTFHHQGRRLNAEAQAARAICERVGVPHVVLGHPRPRSEDVLRTLALTSLCSDEHAQMMPLHDFFMERSAAAFDGIAGDILSNPDDWAEEFFERAERRDFNGIARRMMEGHGEVVSRPTWGAGAGPLYSAGREDEAIEYVGDAIAQLADAPDPYQSFWFWHRTRREIGFVPTSILGSAPAVFCPYLDPAVVELGLSLPYSVTRDQKIHDDALAKAYPAAHGVPFQEAFAEPPVGRRPWQRVRTAIEGLRTLLALRPKSPAGEVLRHLRGSKELLRMPGEIYRMYWICLERLDGQAARHILALEAELEATRPRNLVSETYLPSQPSIRTQEAA